MSEAGEGLLDSADSLIRRSGDYEGAIKIYTDIINSMPNSEYESSALLRMGVAYGMLGDADKKIETFEKLVKEYPRASHHIYLGQAYQEMESRDKALNQYSIVTEEYKNAPTWSVLDAYLGAGECWENMGDNKVAMEYYTRLMARPDLPESPRLTAAQKRLLEMEHGGILPFLGLGFRHTGSVKGAKIVTVFKNGPCANKGIVPEDVLIAIDSQPVSNPRDVIKIVGGKKVGAQITLTVRRKDEDMEIPVVLVERPAELER